MSTRTAKTAPSKDAAAGTTAARKAPAAGREDASAVKDRFERTGREILKGYGDFATFGQENAEALFRSGSIVAKGAEDIGREVITFTETSLRTGMAAGKAMMSVRSLRDLFDLQAEFARSSLDSLIAESVKLSEMSAKLAGEAIEPIGARVNAAGRLAASRAG